MQQHNLKCWPEYFDAIVSGSKRFEIRREDDRHFDVMDVLRLQDYDPKTKRYSGRECLVKVLYLVRGPECGIPAGMVVMSLGCQWDRPTAGKGEAYAPHTPGR
jgi:hypothetical protein